MNDYISILHEEILSHSLTKKWSAQHLRVKFLLLAMLHWVLYEIWFKLWWTLVITSSLHNSMWHALLHILCYIDHRHFCGAKRWLSPCETLPNCGSVVGLHSEFARSLQNSAHIFINCLLFGNVYFLHNTSISFQWCCQVLAFDWILNPSCVQTTGSHTLKFLKRWIAYALTFVMQTLRVSQLQICYQSLFPRQRINAKKYCRILSSYCSNIEKYAGLSRRRAVSALWKTVPFWSQSHKSQH